jgi:hypothetical protein
MILICQTGVIRVARATLAMLALKHSKLAMLGRRSRGALPLDPAHDE